MTRYYLVFILFGFLMGSILYSYLLPKWIKGIDIRRYHQDQNPGAYNAITTSGLPLGSLCLFLDLLKGFLPVFIATYFLDPDRLWFAAVIAAPVAGHAFSPWVRGKGGKAIAVTFGVLIGICRYSIMYLILAFIYVVLSVIVKVDPHRLRVIASMTLLSVISVLAGSRLSFSIGICLSSAVVIFRHVIHQEAEPVRLTPLPYIKSLHKGKNKQA